MKSFYLVTQKLLIDYSKFNGNVDEPFSIFNNSSTLSSLLNNSYNFILKPSVESAIENGFNVRIPELSKIKEVLDEGRCVDIQSEWQEDARGVKSCIYWTVSKVYGNE